MKTYTKEELNNIITLHIEWIKGNSKENCANLSYANLIGTNLSYANLIYANLSYTNLRNANLSYANLIGTNLSYADLSDVDLSDVDLSDANLSYTNLRNANLNYANLRYADLSYADLSDVDLSDANLSYTNLSYTNLRNANLRNANLNHANLRYADLNFVKYNYLTAGFNLSCPEEGEFIGFKKSFNGAIVKLLICKDAKRSSATTRKCRASKAKVLEISGGLEKAYSKYDSSFIYEVGKTIEVKDFDEDRWNECSTGIHFFLTRKEAEEY